MSSQPDETLEELLTPEDVERLFKIPKPTQASMRSRGQIPFVRLAPRTPRYSPKDLRAWLSERAAGPDLQAEPDPLGACNLGGRRR